MTSDPTNQHADQPAAQPTAPPTVVPASPNADQQYAWSANDPRHRRLVRRAEGRWAGGVCTALADQLDVDVTLVRLLTVVATVLGFGSVIIAYLAFWILVPLDRDLAATTPAG